MKKISEFASYIISRCWKEDQPVSVTLFFDMKYEINNKKHSFTKEILEEIKRSGSVKVWGENDKSVCLSGIDNN